MVSFFLYEKNRQMKSATGTWTWSSLVVAAVTACFLVANGVHAGTNPCVSAPCLNGATCTNITATTFNCTCVPGWSGTTCQTNINECASSPCANSATCIDGVNSYSCTCVAGWSGTTCQTQIDECASFPCLNSATCVDGVNSFSCSCVPGWTGSTCQTQIDECASAPCVNSATCVDGLNSWTCVCVPGWSGVFCQTDIPECASNPCQNSGICVDLVNGFDCDCVNGWNGTVCNENDLGYVCANYNESIGQPCFTCGCPVGFVGDRCHEHLCQLQPCVVNNTQSCVGTSSGSGFQCNCVPGFLGIYCQTDLDECASSPCNTSISNCTDLINGYRCDYCSSFQPCMNGGTCVSNTTAPGSFTCTCPTGAIGSSCSQCDTGSGYHFCAGQNCVNWQTDINNCGGCGIRCDPASQVCSSSSCVSNGIPVGGV